MLSVARAFALLTFTSAVAFCASNKIMKFIWDQLPELPPAAYQTNQPGLAGPFAGVHGNVLLIGGGANFPDQLPWDGGKKTWYQDRMALR